jgi:hypothetical protein
MLSAVREMVSKIKMDPVDDNGDDEVGTGAGYAK